MFLLYDLGLGSEERPSLTCLGLYETREVAEARIDELVGPCEKFGSDLQQWEENARPLVQKWVDDNWDAFTKVIWATSFPGWFLRYFAEKEWWTTPNSVLRTVYIKSLDLLKTPPLYIPCDLKMPDPFYSRKCEYDGTGLAIVEVHIVTD